MTINPLSSDPGAIIMPKKPVTATSDMTRGLSRVATAPTYSLAADHAGLVPVQ